MSCIYAVKCDKVKKTTLNYMINAADEEQILTIKAFLVDTGVQLDTAYVWCDEYRAFCCSPHVTSAQSPTVHSNAQHCHN